MNAENIQSIQTENIAPAVTAHRVLGEGDSVFIKVLKDTGGGTYQVLLQGNRINIKSTNPLKPGTSFKAVITSVKDGKVVITPKTEVSSVSYKNFSLLDGTYPDKNLALFLQGRGFIPDAITVRLLNFLQQNGVKIDKNLMARARIISAKFPGKERLAAEAVALLEEKGIEATEKNVAELLMLLEPVTDEEKNKNSGKDAETGGKKSTGQSDWGALKTFFDALYVNAPGPVLDKAQTPAPVSGGSGTHVNGLNFDSAQKEGLLSFINHCTGDGDRHWLFFPYEWNFGERHAEGIIRLMINKSLFLTEKIEINCSFDRKKYYFVVYLNESKVKEVRFCTVPPLLTSTIQNEEKRLGELLSSGMNDGNSVAVTYSPLAYVEGFCTLSEIPFNFEEFL